MKKSVSILVWSNGTPYKEIDRVIDSWHGHADDDFINEIVQKFMKMYKPNPFGFTYRIQIISRGIVLIPGQTECNNLI